jgi:antitoxin (DNA-binding transcriptional repressor) of toxin-antitoxin stability system
MKTWTSEELDRFRAGEEIQIVPHGHTAEKSVTIWIVRLFDGL